MMNRESANKVFFVVYDGAGKQTKTAQLDSKGFNKSVPANCLVCHGSHASYDSQKGRVVGAAFLPFDLDSFRFFDEGVSHPLFPSRSEQEPVFKRLNQLVYQTDLILNDDARELILGWYGGTIGKPGEFPSTTFQGQFVPPGWRNTDSSIQLYRQVIAKSCRTCHISSSSTQTAPAYTFGMATELTFGNSGKFSNNAGRALIDVCQQNTMPNAEQTLGLFWQGAGRPQFLNRAFVPEGSAVQGCGVKALEPAGAASTVQSLQLLDRFAAESCACATPDCLAEADRRYLSEVAALGAPPVDAHRYASAMGKATTCRLDVTTASAPGAATWHQTAAQIEVERSRLTSQGLTSR
jgi:hypothetical protein